MGKLDLSRKQRSKPTGFLSRSDLSKATVILYTERMRTEKKITMTATAETPWEKALMGEPKPRSLCRAQGCEKPVTHVEAAHPTLLDSQRCAECATPGVHVPRHPVGKA